MSHYRGWKDPASPAALRKERDTFSLTMKQASMLRLAPGTNAVPCPVCGARVYRIIVNGKSVEADCAVSDGVEPGEFMPGYGVSHVSRCAGRRRYNERRG